MISKNDWSVRCNSWHLRRIEINEQIHKDVNPKGFGVTYIIGLIEDLAWKRMDTFSNIFLRVATSFPSFFRRKSGSFWSFWCCKSPRLNASRQRFVRVPKVLCKRRWFFPRGQVVELFFFANGCKWWSFTFLCQKTHFQSIFTKPPTKRRSFSSQELWTSEHNRSTGWWFRIFFVFAAVWERFPFWLIFFRWVETTN